MRANTVIMEVVGLLWRYACAILVTLLVWAFIILIGVMVIDKGVIEFLSGAHNHPMHLTACFGIAYTAAFAGVLFGGLCLPGRSRVLACVALLILGLGYYMTFWYVYWRHEMPSKHGNGPLLFPLAAGGLCALWATVLTIRRAKAGNREAGEVRSPGALLAVYSRRCFLIGISAGVFLLWVATYLDLFY
jgi:hypothetical protein